MEYSTFSLLQMYKVDFKPDPKDTAATEMRRTQERDKKGQFFNVQDKAKGVSG